jgi:YVTN family beta-propeller protein
MAVKFLARLLFALAPLVAGAEDLGLLIVHKGGDALGFYQLDGKLLTSVPLGKHPHELVFSADGRYAYITDNGVMRVENAGEGGNTVSIVDLKARKKTGEISLGEFRRPHGIALVPATGRLLVTTELPDQLLLVDPVKRTIIRKYETKGKASHMVVLGRDGKWAYVCNAKSQTVAAIELSSGQVRLIETGGRPETAVLSKDGSKLYVANLDADNITIIDTAKKAVIDRIPTGRGPVRLALTPDERQVVYSLMHANKAQFIDLAARKVIGEIELGGEPVSMSLSPDGTLAYVSLESDDTICVISVPERKLLRKFKTPPGAGPDPVHYVRLN